jgi:hypothetical protein
MIVRSASIGTTLTGVGLMRLATAGGWRKMMKKMVLLKQDLVLSCLECGNPLSQKDVRLYGYACRKCYKESFTPTEDYHEQTTKV